MAINQLRRDRKEIKITRLFHLIIHIYIFHIFKLAISSMMCYVVITARHVIRKFKVFSIQTEKVYMFEKETRQQVLAILYS